MQLEVVDFRVRGLGLQDFVFFNENWSLDACGWFKSNGMNAFSAFFRVSVSASLGLQSVAGMLSSHGLAV